ncbi:S1 RNA-binding domain-containing protein [Candidatus Nomurabacteria bacterium]|uniref:S1 RNA-binding domain-containing protein n=1 Tax=Candidatus Dojkabacteria bacterium TaxID=2099670 RepID=A0A955KYE7_9BACT|nr:S1 RNA-binding domain-containing protein [Candidatus Dojkabacteria bacterium]MCB9789687.1 S1 RNA-binding domain-containing protein [Candidatus Nomurabacteria bacterium]MCB9804037.1 S1 RNA-binding domain-containing protein [Candidatus Nomurabacteria bacterium]
MADSKTVSDPVSQDTSKLYSQFDSYVSDDSHQLKTLSSGDIIKGTVIDLLNGALIVDVGYKSEGIVAGRELRSDLVDVQSLQPGDEILVYVVRPEDEEGRLVLSIRRTQQAGVWIDLEKAKEANDIVEATVVESNNGGVIVELQGGIRGFIPTSQLDAQRVFSSGVRQVGRDISARVQQKLTSLVGQEIKTRIIELDREKNRIILSEKMVTQARDLEQREKTLRTVDEGDVLKGEVSGIAPYGIFVNAAGLEGLVHLSELSWDKVENIGELYKVGDKVDVMVIGVSDGGKRVAYSVKRLQEDPWSEVIAKYKVGDVVEGKVQKVVDFGAFVRIDKGLNGLVHISEMSDKLVKDPRDIVAEGDDVKVMILSISSTERHLGLSLKWDSEVPKAKSKIVSKDTDSKVSRGELAEQIDEVLAEESNS